MELSQQELHINYMSKSPEWLTNRCLATPALWECFPVNVANVLRTIWTCLHRDLRHNLEKEVLMCEVSLRAEAEEENLNAAEPIAL